ncbi:MAG: hypothetical protein ACRCXB_22815 [Aeromonadaceae bacterium]
MGAVEEEVIAEIVSSVIVAIPGAGPWVAGAAVLGYLLGRGNMPLWAKAALKKLALKKARNK